MHERLNWLGQQGFQPCGRSPPRQQTPASRPASPGVWSEPAFDEAGNRCSPESPIWWESEECRREKQQELSELYWQRMHSDQE
eukprot:7863324-Alexandrium_andersonii.AAC.1